MRGIKPRIAGLLCGAVLVLAGGPALAPGSDSGSGPGVGPGSGGGSGGGVGAGVGAGGGQAGGLAPVADATWDQIADCESDGDWAADTGNGYYGGLQIWPPTWREAGGLRYASRPDRADRRQQITVAQEILRQQGWQAWAECAREVGLLP
ncbi:transglycosylase family protein [Kitasatospora sp. NBC_01266]|uniref:transglycosylase family protein n=1 Tax=Kitasatospora sp. NBC_01266 TaxID=2903572 RepID=UPI002E343DD8|nr:transglycosylase family protein [Kitasatospora sp. NBC_01266]